MNPYLIIILALLVADYLLSLVVEWLNLTAATETLPPEFEGWYEPDEYARSQEYLKVTTRFGLLTGTVSTVFTLGFIVAGGFGWVDQFARGFGLGAVLTGLVFAAVLGLAMTILGIPGSAWRIFVIEERFGFNKTDLPTFILDLAKGVVIGGILGALVFGGLVWFFDTAGRWAWYLSWVAITVFQLFVMYLAPVIIMPLFNKFTPLEDGPLKTAILDYATAHQFKLKGIFTMDGSKRSSKANAFFTGFGRFRRIVLFDTLVEKHTVDELLAILAHEMGHFKKQHITKHIILSVLETGMMLFLLSLFIKSQPLAEAFGVEQASVYAGIIFFGFLYSPLSTVLHTATNVLSRKFEYEADAYAASTTGKTESLVDGLKRLTVDNLGNLTPHPLKVFLEYSHPPVISRIQALRERSN